MSGPAPVPDAWPRHVVYPVAVPDAATLAQTSPVWLWLKGGFSDRLQDDVFDLTRQFDYRWVWRGTDWEYASPGYRVGPLLVPWREVLLRPLLNTWAPEDAGLIVLGGDAEALLTHLQRLRLMTMADGNLAYLDLGNARGTETLCESLSASRRAELLGPIHALIWPAVHTAATQWLRVDNPRPSDTQLRAVGDFSVSAVEASAMGEAGHLWFMREASRQLALAYPDLAAALGEPEWARQLQVFAREAAQLNLSLEHDTQHYLRLRLCYPEAPFASDSALRAVLMNRQLSARQRLDEVEHYLQRLASAST